MRFILDTNIISHVSKPAPSEALLAWMADQSDHDLYISSLTVAELLRGVVEKPAGKRRQQLEAWFSGPKGPQALFVGRVLPFDEKAGLAWAKLRADGKARGGPRSALDTIIAAVAEKNACVVVTDKERDFEGVEIINPLRDRTGGYTEMVGQGFAGFAGIARTSRICRADTTRMVLHGIFAGR